MSVVVEVSFLLVHAHRAIAMAAQVISLVNVILFLVGTYPYPIPSPFGEGLVVRLPLTT